MLSMKQWVIRRDSGESRSPQRLPTSNRDSINVEGIVYSPKKYRETEGIKGTKLPKSDNSRAFLPMPLIGRVSMRKNSKKASTSAIPSKRERGLLPTRSMDSMKRRREITKRTMQASLRQERKLRNITMFSRNLEKRSNPLMPKSIP